MVVGHSKILEVKINAIERIAVSKEKISSIIKYLILKIAVNGAPKSVNIPKKIKHKNSIA